MKTNNKTFQKLQSFRPYYFFSVTVFLTTSQTEAISSLQSSLNSWNKWLNNSENLNGLLLFIGLFILPSLTFLSIGLVLRNALFDDNQESYDQAKKAVIGLIAGFILILISIKLLLA